MLLLKVVPQLTFHVEAEDGRTFRRLSAEHWEDYTYPDPDLDPNLIAELEAAFQLYQAEQNP